MIFFRLLKYSFIVLILSVLSLNRNYAQENDFQVWGDIAVKYKINKKFRLNTEFGLRTRENSELLKQYYAEVGLKYKVNKRLSGGMKYRYTDYFIHTKISANRLNFDLEYTFKKWRRMYWSIRERYQYEWLINNMIYSFDDINLRSRVTVAYDIRKSKIEPFFAVEHYLGLNGKMLGLSTQMRWTIGADIPVSSWSEISVSYRIRQQFNETNPITAYILMISYKVSLN